eukprot:scaffold16878_cov134-Isochrysis_galbana.AAC.2
MEVTSAHAHDGSGPSDMPQAFPVPLMFYGNSAACIRFTLCPASGSGGAMSSRNPAPERPVD